MYSKHRQKNAPLSPATCGRLLVFLCLLLLNGTPDSARGEPAEAGLPNGRTVTAQWLSQDQTGTAAGTRTQADYPASGEILLSSTDFQMVLQVQHNHELLAPDFTETFYSEDGKAVTLTSHNHTNHCFYHGHVRGHPGSWVGISTCSGFRSFAASIQTL